MKTKTIVWVVVVAVIVIGLFSLSSYLSPNRNVVTAWKKGGVECLPNGHTNLGQHIHQHIKVTIDGSDVPVAENIGVVSNCLAEIHTHEGEGALIHVETVEPNKEFKLKDFFTVWGENFDKEGFTRTVVVDQATSTNDGADVILKDKQAIQVIYVGLPK